MKLTKKQIDIIRAHTPDEMKGTQVRIDEYLGSFQKEGANWKYHAGWTREGVLVVTAFGEVM